MRFSLRARTVEAAATCFLLVTGIWGQTPNLTLPTTVTEKIIAQNTDPAASQSFLTVQLSNITGAYSVANGIYPGWCVDDPDSNVLEVALGRPMISSYDPTASSLYPSVPWPKINYILNHKQGTFEDIQQAIWMIIFPGTPGHYPVTTAVNTMLAGAAANPNFISGAGQLIAVVIQLDGPSGPGTYQDYIIEVQLPNNNIPAQLAVTCGSVNSTAGLQNNVFTAQTAASGGTPAYTFALASGTLPANLTLSMTGKISGMPVVAGNYSFTVKVTDSSAPIRNTATSAACRIAITSTNTCGPFTTYTQGGWGAAPHGNNPGAVLKAYFPLVFPGGSVSIGSGAKVLTFSSAAAVADFLPAGGTPSTLTGGATNPTSSAAGVFAGQLLSAILSANFSNAGITRSGLSGLKTKSGALAGYTVQQILTLANQVIAGNYSGMPAGLTVSGLSDVLNSINNNFDNGTQNQGYLR